MTASFDHKAYFTRNLPPLVAEKIARQIAGRETPAPSSFPWRYLWRLAVLATVAIGGAAALAIYAVRGLGDGWMR